MKALIFAIFIVIGGFVQLLRCIDHVSSYQNVSFEFDGSFSPELVYNMDADDDDLPVKKRKKRIRSVDVYLAFTPLFIGKVLLVGEFKFTPHYYFYTPSPIFKEHLLRGPPFA